MLPDTELEAVATVNQDVIRLKTMNSQAFYYLSQAYSTKNKTCRAFLMMGLSKDWPQGATWTVVKRLIQYYRKNDLMAEVELNRKLAGLSMTVNESPNTIFAQIASISTWYGKPTVEGHMLSAIIQALPRGYKLLASQYSLSKSVGVAVTLADLETS